MNSHNYYLLNYAAERQAREMRRAAELRQVRLARRAQPAGNRMRRALAAAGHAMTARRLHGQFSNR